MTTKLLNIIPKIAIILMIVLTLSLVATNVFAALTLNPGSVTGSETEASKNVDKWGKQVVGVIQTMGTLAAVAILIVLGIKYMLGSTEEKYEYKKTMIPYLIGAVFIFGATRIAGYVYDFASKDA